MKKQKSKATEVGVLFVVITSLNLLIIGITNNDLAGALFFSLVSAIIFIGTIILFRNIELNEIAIKKR